MRSDNFFFFLAFICISILLSSLLTESEESFILGGIFGYIFLGIGWIIRSAWKTAYLEFISGNYTKAMKYYKHLGDTERLKKCAEMINLQKSNNVQDSANVSVNDSVVMGNVNYNLNELQLENNNLNNNKLPSLLTIISIIVTLFSIFLKINE